MQQDSTAHLVHRCYSVPVKRQRQLLCVLCPDSRTYVDTVLKASYVQALSLHNSPCLHVTIRIRSIRCAGLGDRTEAMLHIEKAVFLQMRMQGDVLPATALASCSVEHECVGGP